MSVEYDHSPLDSTLSVPTSATPSAPAVGEAASAAVLRFRSCRWRKPPEDGEGEWCTHRDVLPLTGTHGFDPEAWCQGCAYYKLRRTPKKSY